MKKVFSSPNLVTVSHLKNILENEGIAALIKNYYLSSAMGEVPPGECWLELWIMDDTQFARAQTLLAENLEVPTGGKAWQCLQCGELLESQFTQCWQCGSVRTSAA